jgi:DNA-directed RNA polymerase beta' subunit
MTSPIVYTCQEGDAGRVRAIQLTLIDPEHIRRHSVVKITEQAIYDKNTPKKGGVYDHHMGVVMRRLACGTCGGMVDSCPGHMGSIELEYPVYHVHFMDKVLKVLRCVCFYCSRFLMPPPWPAEGADASGAQGTPPSATSMATTTMMMTMPPVDHGTATGGGRAAQGKARLGEAAEAVKRGKVRKACWSCGGPQPEYVIARGSSPLVIKADWGGVEFQCEADREAALGAPFDPAQAHNILSHVPHDDYVRMGCDPNNSHPAWMVITVLPVPPPILRPSITETEGSRSRGQDDLTQKLRAIVQANNAIAYHRAAIAAAAGDAKAAALLVPSRPGGLLAGGATPTAAKKAAETPLADLVMALQVEVATYMNNDIRGQKQSTQRSGKPTKGLTERFKGKNGRMRDSLMGKRVDFSSRAVISPDPEIDIDEIGVPYEIAKTLTYPERVTPHTVRDLTRRVRAGPDALAGAQTVIDHNRRTLYLESRASSAAPRLLVSPGSASSPHASRGPEPVVSMMATALASASAAGHRGDPYTAAAAVAPGGAERAPPLQIGWTVERHLREGDHVVLNRQPSLHKMSMMGHRVVPMPGRTFRINLAVTSAYNADFDGDEMNMHVPQSETARAEVAEVMNVALQIVSPQANKPVIGLVMDALVGCGFLTANATFLGRDRMMQLAMAMRYDAVGKGSRFVLPPPAIVKARPRWAPRDAGPLWTGKQAFSVLLPAATNVERRVRDVDSDPAAMLLPPGRRPFVAPRRDPTPGAEGERPRCDDNDEYGKEKEKEEDDDEEEEEKEADKKEEGEEKARLRAPGAPYMGCDPRDERVVVVQEGELLAGSLCKQTVGATAGGIVHVIYKDVGPEAVKRFLSDAQRVANRWLSWRGFSVGIEDCMADPVTRCQVDRSVERAVARIDAVCRFAAGVDRDEDEEESDDDDYDDHSADDDRDGTGDEGSDREEEESETTEGDRTTRVKRKRRPGDEEEEDGSGPRGHRNARPADESGQRGDSASRPTSMEKKNADPTGPPPRKRPRVDENELENYVSRLANKVLDQAGRIVQQGTTVRNNAVFAMAAVGSKGSAFNSTQMRGCVGQQSVEGKRIQTGAGSRTLPCYRHAEAVPPPESRGFVRASYERGLTPREMIFASMGGREGLVDTAVKTAETGYIQRRCVKSMESLQVKRGGLVRNANGEIVQFAYGGDGIDATYIERVRCPEVRLAGDPAAVLKATRWDTSRARARCTQEEADAVAEREAARIVAIGREVAAMKRSPFGAGAGGAAAPDDDQLFVPIHLARLVETVCRAASRCPPCPRGPISPTDLEAEVGRLCERIIETAATADIGSARSGRADRAFPPPLRGTAGLRMVAACELRARHVVGRWGATWSAWEAIRSQIVGDEARAGRYLKSLAATGEMVGAIAAQSIGEPSTQMSVVYEERLLVLDARTGRARVVPIGDLVEEAIERASERRPDAVEHDPAADTTFVSLGAANGTHPEEGGDENSGTNDDDDAAILYVSAVDKAGVVRWRRVTGVTRHPPNGALVRVRTRTGRAVTATLAKSFLTLRNGLVVPIDGASLVEGDLLPVNARVPPRAPSADRGGAGARPMRISLDDDDDVFDEGRRRQRRMSEADAAAVARWPIAPWGVDIALARAALDGTAMLPDGRRGDGSAIDGKDGGDDDDGRDDCGCVFWDPIETIERIEDHGRPYVYDLSVETDANFGLANGLQMRDTLRTFHYAGWGAKNVTLGVPRLKEIIDATPNTKRPFITLRLDRNAPGGCTRDAAVALCRRIEHSMLTGLVESHRVDVVHVAAAPFAEARANGALCAGDGDDDDMECPRGDLLFARACEALFGRRPTRQEETGPTPRDHQQEGHGAVEATPPPQQQRKQKRPRGSSSESTTTTPTTAAVQNRTDAPNRRLYVMRYALDRSATESRGLTPADVARRVHDAVGRERAIVAYSEPAMEAWFVEVSLDDPSELFRRFRTSLPPRPSAGDPAAPPGPDDAPAPSAPTKRTRHGSRASGQNASSSSSSGAEATVATEEMARWERAALAAVQVAFMASVHVSGVAGVTRATPVEVASSPSPHAGEDSDGGGETEWGVDVEGNALMELLCMPGVDATRSHSNDIHRVASVLGIEAAAAVLFAEIKAVISFDGTYVNDRHFALAADTMCHRGSVVAMTRHGINRSDHGFLARASFEETVDILFDAAAFAESDRITDGSVTEPIIVGQPAPIGTATSDVLLTEQYARSWRPPGAADADLGASDRAVVVTAPPPPPAHRDPLHTHASASSDRAYPARADAGEATVFARIAHMAAPAEDGAYGEALMETIAEPLVDPHLSLRPIEPATSVTAAIDGDRDGRPCYAPPSPTMLFG